MTKTEWIIGQLTRKLWFRSTLFAVLAVITALIAIALKSYVPASVSGMNGAGSVDKILNILASSMLAVTTFSLSIVVSAYNTASSSVTPRATRLLLEDRTTQNVLATFIGSFLYSLVGIIALSMGAYGTHGRVLLFFVTLGVIVMIVITLLRWIQHLAQFGRMDDTSQRVEQATHDALQERLATPMMGCAAWPETDAATVHKVCATVIGYLQHIDVQMLSDFAEEKQCQLYLQAQPGAFVNAVTPLVWASEVLNEEEMATLRDAFTVGDQRSFAQDPRFGLCVLAEIASRALSPAVNDPGTAIDIIGRAVRVLSNAPLSPPCEPLYPRLYMRPLAMGDLFDDIFTAIARDGAAMIEVQIRLQKAFAALAQTHPAAYALDAERHRTQAFERARTAMQSSADIAVLESYLARGEHACNH